MALKSTNQPTSLLVRVWNWVAASVLSFLLLVLDALESLFNIRKEDSLLEKGKNAGGLLARFGTYVYLDTFLALVTPAIVIAVKSYGLSFVWAFCGVWIYGFVVAWAFIQSFDSTGVDLSVGTDLRRAQDTLRARSPVASVLAMTVLVFKWSFWTGPEQVVIFFRKELNTTFRVVIVLLILTAIQSFFWAGLYSLGYDGYEVGYEVMMKGLF